MTKEELRQSYVDQGYKVEPVADWRQVSSVDNRVKYDVEVSDADADFYTAQVVVDDEGTASEDAQAKGEWEQTPENFAQQLRDWLRTQEDALTSVFAIQVEQLFTRDGVAEANVYMDDGNGKVNKKLYVVKRRNNTFSFEEIV